MYYSRVRFDDSLSTPAVAANKDPRLTAVYNKKVRFDATGSVSGLVLNETISVLGHFLKMVTVSVEGI